MRTLRYFFALGLMGSSASLIQKTKQWLGALWCVVVCLLANPAHAQMTSSLTLNQTVQGVADFKLKRFRDLELQLPLPEGPWTVRSIEPVKSTHTPPIEGLMVFLDRVVNQQVEATLYVGVYPQDNKNWGPGNNCFGSLLSRERGTSLSGYCHSFKDSTHMTSSSSEWQVKVRKSWDESGTRWPKQALVFSHASEVRGRFAVYTNYAIAFSATGLTIDADSSIDNRKKIEGWWINNRQTESVRSAIAWYETYSARVYEAVEGARPTAILAADTPVPKLKLVVKDMSATFPDLALAAPPSTARPESQAQASAQRSSEAERDRLAADLEASRKKQQDLEEQLRDSQASKQKEQEKLLAEQKAKDQQKLSEEAKLKEQKQLALDAQQKEQVRIAQEAAKQKEQERLMADQKVKDQLRVAEETSKANALELSKLKEELANMKLQKVAAVPTASFRKALVIGNDNYSGVSKLVNARQDANAVGRTLSELGYKVTVKNDLNEKEMKATLRQFKNDLEGGDEVIFFYAGHGVQLGSTNYLLPIDIKGESEDQVRDDAIQLQRLLDDMNEKKVKLSLAIIDACRDNPFPKSGRNIGGRGLAPTTAATGQMIIFSAGSGQQALDKLGANDKNPNGLFTRMLLSEMKAPGVRVDNMIRDVRRKVVEAAKSVGHDQVPAIYDQLVGDFYLNK